MDDTVDTSCLVGRHYRRNNECARFAVKVHDTAEQLDRYALYICSVCEVLNVDDPKSPYCSNAFIHAILADVWKGGGGSTRTRQRCNVLYNQSDPSDLMNFLAYRQVLIEKCSI